MTENFGKTYPDEILTCADNPKVIDLLFPELHTLSSDPDKTPADHIRKIGKELLTPSDLKPELD